MRYLGGKSRLSKYIAPIIKNHSDGKEQYVEPFVGSAAVAERLARNGFSLPMLLADAAEDLILMYRKLQSGWVPPTRVPEHFYKTLMNCNTPSALRGFVGYGCSWGGKFFGGYARGEGRNYAAESSRALRKTINHLGGARFILSDYRELVLDAPSIIYCDPPYRGTTKYEAVPEFCSDDFWVRVRGWESEGHTVIVSEYAAPEDFVCIWQKKHHTSVRSKEGSERRTESLFMLK